MRAKMHTVLLLLCTLAAADTEPPLPCGSWLVKNGDPTEIIIEQLIPEAQSSVGVPSNEHRKRMKCTSRTTFQITMPRMIRFNSMLFDYLDCDNTGWKGEPIESGVISNLTTVSDAYSPFTVSCRTYCFSRAEGGTYDVSLSLDDSKVTARCSDPTEDLFHDEIQVGGNEATCTSRGWSTLSSKRYNSDVLGYSLFVCEKALCSFLPAEGVIFDVKRKELRCAHTEASLRRITVDSELYIHGLTCDETGEYNENVKGWVERAHEKNISKPYERIHPRCIIEHCASSGNRSIFRDYDEIIANCSTPGFGMKYKSYQFEEARCMDNSGVKDGWIFYNWSTNSWHKIADFSEKVELNCVDLHSPPCVAPTGNGIFYDENKKILKCKGNNLQAFKLNSKIYSHMSCTELYGWSASLNGEFTYVGAANASLTVSCVDYCVPTGTGFYPKINYDKERVTVECRNEELFYDGGRVDGEKAVCSFNHGWEVEKGRGKMITIRSDASSPIHFECRPYPTIAPKIVTTTTTKLASTSTTTIIPIASTVANTANVNQPEMSNAAQMNENGFIAICFSIGGIISMLSGI